MAVRNPHIESVPTFQGLNTLGPATNLPPNAWIESSNAIVSAAGTAVAMRSPKAWNTVPGDSTVRSAGSYLSPTQGGTVFFDTNAAGSATINYTQGAGNIAFGSTFTQGAGFRPCWLTVNGKMYMINGSGVFEQFFHNGTAWTHYNVGVNAPLAAPTVSIVAGGSLVLNVGVTVSYAYYNGDTAHVGQCSAPSASSGATGANQTLRTAVVASTQTGVTNIVLFVSVDGGAIRYVVVNAAGVPILYPNTTGNIDITAPYISDKNTAETLFNVPLYSIVALAYQVMFRHQDRVILLNQSSAAPTGHESVLAYSGLESVTMGNPTECYPPLNIVALPARGEPMKAGVSTPVGALVMSDRESYLLSGQLIDIVVSAQNTLQTYYSFASLQWGIGSRSPFTVKVTPFGVIWLDQTKRIQMWPYSGLPTEIGIALRNELANIQDTDAARFMAEATWFQYGEQQYYVLSASTTGSTNNMLFIIGIYEAEQSQTNAYQTLAHPINVTTATSDIAAQSIITHIDLNGVAHCLEVQLTAVNGNADGGLKDILNLNLQGDGWKSGQSLFFGVTTGNFKDNANWNSVHSVRYDSQVADITVQTRNFDGSEVVTERPEIQPNENQTLQAVINRYGVHKKIRFTFPTDDTKRREIQNLRVTYSGKSRP